MSEGRMLYPGAILGGSAGGLEGMTNKEKCPACGSPDITKSAKIWKCNKCGRESRDWNLKKCSKCQTVAEAEQVYCMECGAKLGPVKKGTKMTENMGGLSTAPLFK